MQLCHRYELTEYRQNLGDNEVTLFGISNLSVFKFDGISKQYLYSGDKRFSYPNKSNELLVFTTESEAWKCLYKIMLNAEERIQVKIDRLKPLKDIILSKIEERPDFFI